VLFRRVSPPHAVRPPQVLPDVTPASRNPVHALEQHHADELVLVARI
jgi:hypothetical protein